MKVMPLQLYSDSDCPYCGGEKTISIMNKAGKSTLDKESAWSSKCLRCGKDFALNWTKGTVDDVFLSDKEYFLDKFFHEFMNAPTRDIDEFLYDEIEE